MKPTVSELRTLPHTRENLEKWGVEWPPKKGWMRKLKGNSHDGPAKIEGKAEPKQVVSIIFDGGSTCNIPRLGYGNGYGSYQINGGEIHRWDSKRNMSSNAAEIFTLHQAVLHASLTECREISPGDTALRITGDSRIALKWARAGMLKNPVLAAKGSVQFIEAIKALWSALDMFHSVEAKWWGRGNSVLLFGH